MIKEMIAHIYKDTGIKIIRANQLGKLPSLPYAVYNITAPYVKGIGQPNIYFDDDSFHLKQTEEYFMTISFNIFAQSDELAIELAKNIWNWFSFQGYEFLEDSNLVVHSLGNIENRTTFLVDSYEYKHGFDVQLRTIAEKSMDIDWFEHVQISRGE